MRHRALAGLVVGAVMLLAACSSSGATVAPSAAAPSAEASTAASAPAAGGGATCSQSAAAGQVAVAIKDFTFGPADIQAKVGDVITFTNDDSAPHTATLDDGACSTGTISPNSVGRPDVHGRRDATRSTARSTPSMKGTITIS